MMHMTEVNSRLTKDILSKNRECQDMHVQLFEATVNNSRLMDQLSQLAIENQQLRLQMLAIQEENEELHSQLSYSSRKWANRGFPSYGEAYRRLFLNQDAEEGTNANAGSPEDSPESWEEVSQKLLNQMKQEMKEMEDLGQRLAAENTSALECGYCEDGGGCELNVKLASDEANASLSDSDLERVKTLIQGMKGQSEHLKGQLITQRTVLQSALKQLKKVVKAGAVVVTEKANGASGSDISKNKFDRPSDELFRAYFTQQLHNSSGGLQQGQRSADSDEKSNTEVNKEMTFEQKSGTSRERSPEEKICPVCEASFPYETPLDEFQNHVMDHFENENSTLMQQYELL